MTSTRVGIVCLTVAIACATPVFGFQDAGAPRKDKDLDQRVTALEQALDRMGINQTQAAQAVPAESPAPEEHPRFTMPPELVPEIGKVGAQVGLLISGSSNPYHLDSGSFVAGFIDLPLIDRPKWLHGKIAYEITVGMSESNTTMTTTSNVAQVANLTVLNTLNPNGGLANVAQAVTGTGSAPFPVTTPVVTKLRLLEVIPFSFKYTNTSLDRWRLRPYGLIGFGTYVTIHNQNPISPNIGVRQDANLPSDVLAAVNQLFGGKAPFGGPLVAGQISQSPELEALGLPGGHGNIDFGYLLGVGLEYRVSRTFSLGFDSRFNKIAGAPGMMTTYGTRLGFHF